MKEFSHRSSKTGKPNPRCFKAGCWLPSGGAGGAKGGGGGVEVGSKTSQLFPTFFASGNPESNLTELGSNPDSATG